MQINMSVFGSGLLIETQKLRYTAAEEQTPEAIVTTLTQDPPHVFPVNVTLNVPNPVPHRVNIYSTPDASVGTLVASFVYNPTWTNVEVRLPLEFAVGGMGPYDPADGDTATPVNPTLIGWDWYPGLRGIGVPLSQTEYIKTESVLGGGFDGFSLTGDFVFTEPDVGFIFFNPKITLSQPVFTYLNLYNGVKEVPASTTLDATFYRQVCEFTSSGATPNLTLLNLVNVPDNTLLVFSTMRGAQQQAIITAAGGEIIKYLDTDYPALFMGRGEVLWLLRRADGWHVVNDWQGMARVGVQTFTDAPRPNIIVFNGGGLVGVGGVPMPLPRADWPRLEWYCNTQLSVGQFITKAARDAGGDLLAGSWAFDATNIYAPDYRGTFPRALPGTRGNDSSRDNTALPGSYRADLQKDHKHFTVVDEQVASSGFPAFVNAIKSLIKNYNKTSGSGKESTYQVGSVDNATPTLAPTSGVVGLPLSSENAGKSTGVYVGCYA